MAQIKDINILEWLDERKTKCKVDVKYSDENTAIFTVDKKSNKITPFVPSRDASIILKYVKGFQ